MSQNKYQKDIETNYLPSPPLSTDNRGCIKPQKNTQPCGSCQGFGWYQDFGYDEPRQRQCEACHGLGYEAEE